MRICTALPLEVVVVVFVLWASSGVRHGEHVEFLDDEAVTLVVSQQGSSVKRVQDAQAPSPNPSPHRNGTSMISEEEVSKEMSVEDSEREWSNLDKVPKGGDQPAKRRPRSTEGRPHPEAQDAVPTRGRPREPQQHRRAPGHEDHHSSRSGYSGDALQDLEGMLSPRRIRRGGSLRFRRGSPAKAMAGGKRKVLIIIDMQKDYQTRDVTAAEIATKVAKKGEKVEVAGIRRAQANINKLKELKHGSESVWDLVIYTLDWLKPGTGFAEMRQPGAWFMPEIAPRDGEKCPGPKCWIFTKDTDDAMTELFDVVDIHERFEESRHFSIDPPTEGLPGAMSLPRRLSEGGFTPEETQLVITGTQTTRCVMKTAIHSKELGYDVKVFAHATAGGANDNWTPKTCKDFEGVAGSELPGMHTDSCAYLMSQKGNVPTYPCGIPRAGLTVSAVPFHNGPCGSRGMSKFRKLLYFGWHGGPDFKGALDYMMASGVTVDPTTQDLAGLEAKHLLSPEGNPDESAEPRDILEELLYLHNEFKNGKLVETAEGQNILQLIKGTFNLAFTVFADELGRLP